MPAIRVTDECYERLRKEAEEKRISIRAAAEQYLWRKEVPIALEYRELIETINQQISILQDLVLKVF